MNDYTKEERIRFLLSLTRPPAFCATGLPGEDPPPADPPPGQGSGSGGQQQGSGEEDSWTPPTKAEYDALKADADKAKAAAAKADQDRRRRERDAANATGDADKIREQAERERDDAKAEADAARLEAQSLRQSRDLDRAVTRAGVPDAELVRGMLTEDDYKSDASLDRALKKITEKYPQLAGQRQRSGLPMNGGSGGGSGSPHAAMNDAIRAAAGRG